MSGWEDPLRLIVGASLGLREDMVVDAGGRVDVEEDVVPTVHRDVVVEGYRDCAGREGMAGVYGGVDG